MSLMKEDVFRFRLSLRLRLALFPSLWPIALLVALYFCQIWVEVGGFTIRSEDILVLILLGAPLLGVLSSGWLVYRRGPLDFPLLLWCVVLVMSIGVTLLSPFDSVTKKDALVNGVRLMLSVGVFFIVRSYPASAIAKQKVVGSIVLGFSLLTTVVALLQIAYWEGVPLPLPSILTEKAPGSNTQKGREIFALFVGDTSAHTWSGMLASQALLVFLYASHGRRPIHRWGGFAYFVVLVLILLRIAVRNSMLGLVVAIIGLGILRSRHPVRLLLKLMTLGLVGVGLVLGASHLQSDSYFLVRALAVVPRIVDGRLVISGASSIYGRLEMFGVALRLFAQRPLAGYGFYSYQALNGLYLPRATVHAHNSYLQTLAEAGLVGAIALVWLMLSVGHYLARSRRYFKPREPGMLWWEFAVGSALYLAFSMVFSNTFWSPNYVAFRAIVLGVLASLVRERVT